MDLLLKTFSNELSPADLLRQTFSDGPSPVDLLQWTSFDRLFSMALLLQTFSNGPSSVDLLPQTFFWQSTCRPSFGHINLPCSQFWRRILRPCLTAVTSTRRVNNSDNFSNDSRFTHRNNYMSNKFVSLGLSTYVTHLTYML